ncbi:hypothetical protein HispidOSU_027979, partial [Sigmodon hispidus]
MARSFLVNPSETNVSRQRSPGSDAHADCSTPGALKTSRCSGSRIPQPRPRGESSSRCSAQPQRPPASGQGEPGASCRTRKTIPDTPGSRCQPAGMRVQSSPRGTARAWAETKTEPRSARLLRRDFSEKRKHSNRANAPASPTGGRAAAPEPRSPGSPEGAHFSSFNETLQALTPGPACPRTNGKAAPRAAEPAPACREKQ